MYERITQLPSFCGPTCVQMVLSRHGIKLNQEEIATELETTILEEKKHLYTLKHPIAPPDAGKQLGVPLEAMAPGLERLFRKHNLGFKAEMFTATSIDDLEAFISSHLLRGNDLIVNFWLRQKPPKKDVGHFCLIDALENETVRLCDPDGDAPPFRSMDLNELQEVMGTQWDGNERGIIVVEKT